MLLSGGETTVTVRGKGRGGRNVEFLLSAGDRARRPTRHHALAGDTDGVDGAEEIAGAIADPDTLARAAALGLKPQRRLDDNDGHGFFEALGDAVVTGPTLHQRQRLPGTAGAVAGRRWRAPASAETSVRLHSGPGNPTPTPAHRAPRQEGG